jgi:hypothetical protein
MLTAALFARFRNPMWARLLRLLLLLVLLLLEKLLWLLTLLLLLLWWCWCCQPKWPWKKLRFASQSMALLVPWNAT